MSRTKPPKPEKLRRKVPASAAGSERSARPDPCDLRAALTPDEEVFVSEYLRTFKAGRAYRAIRPHVTPGSARVLGCRWLTKVNVSREIEARATEHARAAGISSSTVLRAAAGVLHADPADCFDEDDRPLPLNEIPEATRRALVAVKDEEYTHTSGTGAKRRTVSRRVLAYRMPDKVAALAHLLRHARLQRGRSDGRP